MQRLTGYFTATLGCDPQRASQTFTQYLAYVGVVSAAVMFAIGALVFSGQTAVSWLDMIRRPVESRTLPMTQNVTFAALPSGVPHDIQNSAGVDRF